MCEPEPRVSLLIAAGCLLGGAMAWAAAGTILVAVFAVEALTAVVIVAALRVRLRPVPVRRPAPVRRVAITARVRAIEAPRLVVPGVIVEEEVRDVRQQQQLQRRVGGSPGRVRGPDTAVAAVAVPRPGPRVHRRLAGIIALIGRKVRTYGPDD